MGIPAVLGLGHIANSRHFMPWLRPLNLVALSKDPSRSIPLCPAKTSTRSPHTTVSGTLASTCGVVAGAVFRRTVTVAIRDQIRVSRFQCSLALFAVENLSLWLVQSNASQPVWGGAMNATLFAAAGNAESASWGRFVVSCEVGSLRVLGVLSGLQVKDNGNRVGRSTLTLWGVC